MSMDWKGRIEIEGTEQAAQKVSNLGRTMGDLGRTTGGLYTAFRGLRGVIEGDASAIIMLATGAGTAWRALSTLNPAMMAITVIGTALIALGPKIVGFFKSKASSADDARKKLVELGIAMSDLDRAGQAFRSKVDDMQRFEKATKAAADAMRGLRDAELGLRGATRQGQKADVDLQAARSMATAGSPEERARISRDAAIEKARIDREQAKDEAQSRARAASGKVNDASNAIGSAMNRERELRDFARSLAGVKVQGTDEDDRLRKEAEVTTKMNEAVAEAGAIAKDIAEMQRNLPRLREAAETEAKTARAAGGQADTQFGIAAMQADTQYKAAVEAEKEKTRLAEQSADAAEREYAFDKKSREEQMKALSDQINALRGAGTPESRVDAVAKQRQLDTLAERDAEERAKSKADAEKEAEKQASARTTSRGKWADSVSDNWMDWRLKPAQGGENTTYGQFRQRARQSSFRRWDSAGNQVGDGQSARIVRNKAEELAAEQADLLKRIERNTRGVMAP